MIGAKRRTLEFVAEHVLRFQRGFCRGSFGGGTVGENHSEFWIYCDRCKYKLASGETRRCPEYVFPKFTFVDVMRELGVNGVPTHIRYDTIRNENNFTIIGPAGRICDTDDPLMSLCVYLEAKYQQLEDKRSDR